MKQGKRWASILTMVFLLMMAVLLLAGCAGDDDSGPFALNECRLDDADCRLR